jgi:hypothetical protein
LALHGGEWSVSCAGCTLTPVPIGWVGFKAGLDTEARGKILRLCQGSNPGRPVCSQTNVNCCYIVL